MNKYYQQINSKNKFLNMIIAKYNQKPSKEKKTFILSYLKTCSLFINFEYMITFEIKGKHYFHLQSYLDNQYEQEDDFEECNCNRIIDTILDYSREKHYRIDYIQIETLDKNKLVFTFKEYFTSNIPINQKYINRQDWLNY